MGKLFMQGLFFFLSLCFCMTSSAQELLSLQQNQGLHVSYYNSSQGPLIKSERERLLPYAERIFLSLQDIQQKAVPTEIIKTLALSSLEIVLLADLSPDGLFVPAKELYKVKINANKKNPHLFLNTNLFDKRDSQRLLAHEYFHWIHYLLNPGEKQWMREGLAQYFEYMALNKTNGHLVAAIKNGSTPLEGDYHEGPDLSAQYGHNFLYIYYLIHKCQLNFWQLVGALEKGPLLYARDKISYLLSEGKLQKRKGCRNFSDSALHFEITKVHNRKSYQGEKADESYFLFPHSHRTYLNTIKTTSDLKHYLQAAKPFLPMQIAPSLLKIVSKYHVKIIFQKQVFPFDITFFRPKNLAFYKIIILKL